MKPIIDEQNCIGCGLCETMCPTVFQIDDDGIARAVSENGTTDCQDAADACPTGAIVIG